MEANGTITAVGTTIKCCIQKLFLPEHRAAAERLLSEECSHSLPLLKATDKEAIERVQLATLKVSAGSLEKLITAVELAQRDWRDVLVAAGFAQDVQAHKKWWVETTKA